MRYQTYLQYGLKRFFEAVITVKLGQISRLCSHNIKYNTNFSYSAMSVTQLVGK